MSDSTRPPEHAPRHETEHGTERATDDAPETVPTETEAQLPTPSAMEGVSAKGRICPKGEGLTGEDLGFVMDVPVEVTVEIGRKKMRIADVLKIGPGTVLELDKASGESLDILVNNRLLARGEAVVVGERYGVRLTEVVSLVGKVTERS